MNRHEAEFHIGESAETTDPADGASSGNGNGHGETTSATTRPGPFEVYLFRFTGTGGSYFRIWIVNLLLSILTLGIYSAWAKVRREQYFHRNLQLAGASFDYHGSAKAILKGRLLVFGVLIILNALHQVSPSVELLGKLLLLPLIPWIIVRAMRFRAVNTSYRGVRFDFVGTYRDVLVLFLKYGLLTVCTLGLGFPVLYAKLNAYCVDRLQYGQARWHSRVGIWDSVACAGPGLVLCLAYGGLLFLMPFWAGSPILTIGFSLLSVWLFMVALPALFIAQLGRLVWNNSGVAEGHFVSELAPGPYLRLSTINWVLILLSLGLYLPYARVALASYRASKTALVYPGGLDNFIAQSRSQTAALGDEAGEALGLDLAL